MLQVHYRIVSPPLQTVRCRRVLLRNWKHGHVCKGQTDGVPIRNANILAARNAKVSQRSPTAFFFVCRRAFGEILALPKRILNLPFVVVWEMQTIGQMLKASVTQAVTNGTHIGGKYVTIGGIFCFCAKGAAQSYLTRSWSIARQFSVHQIGR
jgi:hypothetical protein